MRTLNYVAVLALVMTAFVYTGCNKDKTDPADDAYANADFSKGGIMYDKFWSEESGFDQNDPNISTYNDYKDFFRCKQCHGWDGLGNQGAYIGRAPKTTRPNVSSLNLYQIAQTKSHKELFDALKSSTDRRDVSTDLSSYDPATNSTDGDKMPNLSQIFTDAQLWDIVKFLKEGMFDVSKLYDGEYTGTYPNGSVAFNNVGKDGNAANGDTYFSANCAVCHGADGTQIELEDGKTVGSFVRTKANEVQHKVKYGQLGSDMKGHFDISVSEMKDLYKALSNTDNYPDNPTTNADFALGGIMFDKFWAAESGFDQNDPNMATFDTYKDFFRCKQCHGWDGLGRNGAYIGRTPKTTRPNVADVSLMEVAQNDSPQEIFDAIKGTGHTRRDISYDLSTYDPETNNVDGDLMPNYSQILSDEQIWNIVSFIKDHMFDVSLLYDATYDGSYPNGTVTFSNVGLDGNASEGNTFYSTNCAPCHGADGTTIALEDGRTVGSFVREKANETQHKVKYGQLGTPMTGHFDITIDGMKNLYKACADANNFPD